MKKIFMMINPGGKLQDNKILLVNHCSTWNNWNQLYIILLLEPLQGVIFFLCKYEKHAKPKHLYSSSNK